MERIASVAYLAMLGMASSLTAQPFSTFLQDNATILSLGHDAAGILYTLTTTPDGARFLTRYDSAATKVLNSTTVGGCDAGTMVVDRAGNALLAGGDGSGYPCLLKLDISGKPVWTFVVERTARATVQAVALDSVGSILITGYALENGFPSAGGGYSAPNGSIALFSVFQPFVARIDASGTRLLSSAVGVGGGHIAMGPGGDVFVSGNAPGFFVGTGEPANLYPVTPGAFQTTFQPSFDCTSFLCQLSFPSPEQYVTRLDSGLTKLIYSTYVTGSHGANNRGLIVDSDGNAYLTGDARSDDYPYTASEQDGGRPHEFLTKLDATGSKLVWSVRQGGDLLAFDQSGNLLVAGSAMPSSGLPYQYSLYPLAPPPEMPGVPDACRPNGIRVQVAAVVQRLSADDGTLVATQVLSGTQLRPASMNVLADGRILVGGSSVFPDVPITPGTVFSSAAAGRTASGVFLAAFDLATPSLGGALACAFDGLTNLPLAPVSPGQWISLFGNGFDSASVAFDGMAAQLTYTSDGQINAVVPPGLTGNTTTMTVTANGTMIATREFAVAALTPSVFVDTGGTVADGNGFFPAIALNSDGTKNSQSNPATAGSMVTLFLNGVSAGGGTVPVTVKSGTLALQTGPLQAWPGQPGTLSEVQVTIPPSTPTGLRAVGLAVSVGGVPASPLVWLNQVYQGEPMVWVQF